MEQTAKCDSDVFSPAVQPSIGSKSQSLSRLWPGAGAPIRISCVRGMGPSI